MSGGLEARLAGDLVTRSQVLSVESRSNGIEKLELALVLFTFEATPKIARTFPPHV